MATVITITYADNVTMTLDVSSLADSSTWTAGRESTAVDNTSNMYVDAIVDNPDGLVANANTIGQEIRIYCWGQNDSAATKNISTLAGTDAARTITVEALQALRLAAAIPALATGSLTYYFQPFSVAALFGGIMPKFWGLFVTHSMVSDFGATQASKFRYSGIKYTST
jgi:hypothetical protein